MLRLIYSIIFYFSLPLLLLRLWWKSRRLPAYRERWAERFALVSIPNKWRRGLWIHTVSLGEVVAATPLIKAIQKRYPSLPITLTTMTVTGSERVRANFSDSVFHCYVPYDLPGTVHRFLKKLQPSAVMIFETELWPNLLAICKNKKIPLMLTNARLSERSARGYRYIPTIAKQMLSAFDIIATHAHSDAERFIHLGADPSRVHVVGSIKYEVDIPASVFEQAEALRVLWGIDRPVWIAASTHAGEESQILQAFREVQAALPEALLILAPRHPERFSEVLQACKQAGYVTATRSSQQPCNASIQVFLADTLGELKLFYAAADVVFIGGSLVPVGGHNVLEPLAVAKPTITGPYMFNFQEITETLLKARALIQIQKASELAQQVITLLKNSGLRVEIETRGQQVIEQNKGALEKNLRLIAELIAS